LDPVLQPGRSVRLPRRHGVEDEPQHHQQRVEDAEQLAVEFSGHTGHEVGDRGDGQHHGEERG
jgi:hypothetical protein